MVELDVLMAFVEQKPAALPSLRTDGEKLYLEEKAVAGWEKGVVNFFGQTSQARYADMVGSLVEWKQQHERLLTAFRREPRPVFRSTMPMPPAARAIEPALPPLPRLPVRESA